MTEDVILDSKITEPPLETGSEADLLLCALDRSRAQFAWKCGGLDAAALNKPFPSSAMTLGSLVKHMAAVEERYAMEFLTGETAGPPWSTADWAADPKWDRHSAAEDSPDELYRLWRDAVERSRSAVAVLLAQGGPDQRSKFTSENGETPKVRRVLVDLHDEYARHVGHADLFREAVDELVGEDPPQR